MQQNMYHTKAGNGISYTIPHSIAIENIDEKVKLFMRPRNVYENVKLIVIADDEIIKTAKKKHMAPGEMENITIEKSLLENKDYKILKVEVVKESE